jgi:hypothetical protein
MSEIKMLHESREMNAPSENDAKYNDNGTFDERTYMFDMRKWRLNQTIPKENDKKYYVNGGYDGNAFANDYAEYEKKLEEISNEYYGNMDLNEEPIEEKPKKVIRKIKTMVRIEEDKNTTTIIPARVVQPTPAYKSSSAITSAKRAIEAFASEEKEQQLTDTKVGVSTLISKKLIQYAPEIEKIKYKMDSKKEAMSETLSEKRDKRADIIKAQIDAVDVKIQNREKQVQDSENKLERIRSSQIPAIDAKYDDELARLKAEYEAKVNAVEAKRRASIEKLNDEAERSRQYAEGVKAEIIKLEAQKMNFVGKLDNDVNMKVRLAHTEYAKLNMIKTSLENEHKKITDWIASANTLNYNLRTALEEYYEKDYYDIDYDITDKYNFLEEDDKNHRYAFMFKQYNSLNKRLSTSLTQVNELLNCSIADEDYTYNGDD